MRWLVVFLPGTVIATAWASEAAPVSVAYGHFPESESVALRQGEECWAPVSLASTLGWRLKLGQDSADLQAEGRTLRVPARMIGQTPHFLLGEAARQLGAVTWWDGTTYRVNGQIRELSFVGSHLKVDGTLSFRTNTFILENPKRLVVDMVGLSLKEDQEFPLPVGVRVGQVNPNTVRFVIQHPDVVLPRTTRPGAARFLDLSLAPFNTSKIVTEPPFVPELQGNPTPQTSPTGARTTPAPTTTPPRVLQTLVETVAEGNRTTIRMTFDRDAGLPAARYIDATTIQLDLANTVLGPSLQLPNPSNVVESIEVQPNGQTAQRLTLRLKQPHVFQLAGTGTAATLTLRRPKNADGRLEGKTIVLDAGHGGSDSGAVWKAAGMMEKVLALNVARFMAEDLQDAGANVIMTRNSDVRIPLNERSAIANRSNADLFISVHFNSNRTANTASGTKTFHHMRSPEGILLATCIHNELVKVSNLPNMGVWSDSRIYQSGFAVLRNSRMPSVLLELAFINNSRDRAQMAKTEWQKAMASAAVRGIRIYFGDVKEQTKP